MIVRPRQPHQSNVLACGEINKENMPCAVFAGTPLCGLAMCAFPGGPFLMQHFACSGINFVAYWQLVGKASQSFGWWFLGNKGAHQRRGCAAKCVPVFFWCGRGYLTTTPMSTATCFTKATLFSAVRPKNMQLTFNEVQAWEGSTPRASLILKAHQVAL